MTWIHRKRVHDFFISKIEFPSTPSHVISVSGDYTLKATKVEITRGIFFFVLFLFRFVWCVCIYVCICLLCFGFGLFSLFAKHVLSQGFVSMYSGWLYMLALVVAVLAVLWKYFV